MCLRVWRGGFSAGSGGASDPSTFLAPAFSGGSAGTSHHQRSQPSLACRYLCVSVVSHGPVRIAAQDTTHAPGLAGGARACTRMRLRLLCLLHRRQHRLHDHAPRRCGHDMGSSARSLAAHVPRALTRLPSQQPAAPQATAVLPNPLFACANAGAQGTRHEGRPSDPAQHPDRGRH